MSLFLLFGSVTAVLAAFAAVVASAREFGFDAFRPTVTRKLRQYKVKVKFLVGIEGKICVFFFQRHGNRSNGFGNFFILGDEQQK